MKLLIPSLLVLTLFFHAGAAEKPPVFRVGAAVVDVTPPKFPVRVNGMFTERLAQGAVDRLHARSIALDDGTTKIVLCIVDTCMMPRDLIDRAKTMAAASTGLSVERMMISATHTHSGASAMGCLGSREDPDYAAWLPGRLAESIAAALHNLQPARLGWASVDDWEDTHNRRWIHRFDKVEKDPFGEATVRANMHPGHNSTKVIGVSGPVDPQLSVLAFQTPDGKPLALLANYSQHYFDSPLLSADYYGVFCRHIAKKLGQSSGEGPFVAAMSQGTSGDLTWIDYGALPKKNSLEAYSEAVADNAMEAYQKITWHDHVSLGMVQKTLSVGWRAPGPARVEWSRQRVAALNGAFPSAQPDIYAQEALFLHEKPPAELVLQAMRIGDLSIATLPNEVYSLTGLKLRAQSPMGMHFNLGLANGAEGYIPPPEQHVLGGYTTWPARTAGLEPQAEPKIVEALLGALEEVTGQKRRPMRDEHGPYAKAILEAKPASYWRLNDVEGRGARNAVPGAPEAQITDGVVWYLPGAGSGKGHGAQSKLTPSAFSGPVQINRAAHFAGGELIANIKDAGDESTMAFWFWLGEASGASERSGQLVAWPGAEQLVTRQTAEHRASLVLVPPGQSAAEVKGTNDFRADEWHFIAVTRKAGSLSVYLDGTEQPCLIGPVLPSVPATIHFGSGLQGKLDEIAVFNRALTTADTKAFWKASDMEGQRAREKTEQEKAEKEVAERSKPPQFPLSYPDAVKSLNPVVFWSLQEPLAVNATQGGVKISGQGHAEFTGGRIRSREEKLGTAYTVSMWFNNQSPNNLHPVTAYFFSRGKDGADGAPGDHFGIGGTFEPEFTGRLLFFNGNATQNILAGKTIIPPGTWNHAVFIRDGGKLKAFLNGMEQPEFSGEAPDTMAGAKEFFLGARSDNFAPLKGFLANFALFDRALTDEEALQLHTASGQAKGTPKAVEGALPKPGTDSQPLSPRESLKTIQVPPGYRVELMAAEPLVLDPVAFDWDERGRLWVVEMADYPLGMDGKGKSGGRVRILEDTDNDGRYDKATLFAEGLNFPTGILCWRDGCLVTAAPDIWFLREGKGSGKEESREKLFTGFLEGNQQLRVNGLRWGLDGWVYCANGGHHVDYGKEIAVTSARTGEKIALGSRDFRFKPDTGEFDPLSGPSQFGRNRDAWGNWFGVQNSYPIWHYVLEDRYLRRNPHVAPPSPKNVLTPSNPPVYPLSGEQKRYHSFKEAGHFTSACAAAPYLDSKLFGTGKEVHSFTCEPVHNLVQHFILEEEGVSFKARRAGRETESDFFASTDPWCRPVMTRTGPDGALWVADMYRYMIEHPQWLPENGKSDFLPFYREGEDKGRLYRVSTTTNSTGTSFNKLVAQLGSPAGRVAALESSNGWLRDKAHMLLLWHNDQAAVPALLTMAKSSSQALARAIALNVLDGLGALTSDSVSTALHDPDEHARVHALRLAESRKDDLLVREAVKLAGDSSAMVRLQLACSLGEWTQAEAGEALATLAKLPGNDGHTRAAILSSVLPHLKIVAASLGDAGNTVLGDYLEPLIQIAEAARQPEATTALLLRAIPTAAKGKDLESIQRFLSLQLALKQSGTTLKDCAARAGGQDRETLLQRAEAITALSARLVADESQELSSRIAAAALLALDPAHRVDAIARLAAWLNPSTSADLQREIVKQLASAAPADTPALLLKNWSGLGPDMRLAVLDSLMNRENWTLELLKAVKSGEVAASAFDAQRQAQLLKHPSAQVRKLAEPFFVGTATAARAKVIEAFQPALSLKGDAARGKDAFAKACIACHQLDEIGVPLGPDLRSVVNHDAGKLLNSILDPSANIEPSFTAYFCELKNGEQLYGIVTGETGGSLQFKLADASVRPILRQDIVKLQSSKASLMPDGLEALLTPQSLADLIVYLKTAR